MESLLDSLLNFSASFLLELGNTISSLFGGGTSSDAKENGTDAVQVRAEKQTSKWLGLGRCRPKQSLAGLPAAWTSVSLSGLHLSPMAGCLAPASLRFEPLPEPTAYCSYNHLLSYISGIPTAPVCLQVSN